MLFVSIVGAFVAVAAVSDLRTRRLPNWLTVPAFAAGLVAHSVMNGFAGLGFALLGFATGFGILLVLWLIGGGGGGDVKLMGALGAWLGSSLIVFVFVTSGVLTLVATIAILLAGMMGHGYSYVHRRYVRRGEANRPGRRQVAGSEEARLAARTKRRLMPYAVPVALGTWTVLALAWMAQKLPW
ncbi:MAG: A24 family peptidase [Patescibacteria group bacterium]|nr:A24 family peptidase [Patescibacteria group bacterium]